MKFRTRTWALSTALVIALAGCAGTTEPVETPSATESALPEVAPTYFPEGSANQNKAYFDWVMMKHITEQPKATHLTIVDALVAGGFNKKAMEVTPSKSGTGKPADAIIVSVKIQKLCLVGQRMLDGTYYSSVERVLATGKCLVGETEPIN